MPPGSGLVTLADIPPLLGDDASPQAPHRRGPRPGPEGLLGLVRGDVPRIAGGGGRAADEQAPRVPAPPVRQAGDRGRPVHLRHGRGPRQRRAVPGPAAQGHPRRGDRAARRVVHRRPDLAGRRPPRPAARAPPARTPACTSTSARTSSTCPTRWKTCSPRPAPTGSPSPWRTRTSPSSPRTCARASPRTPAPRSSSACRPRTPRDLEHHTAPVLTAHDLSHLDAYQAAARLVAGSAEKPAFTLRTRPLPPPVPGRARLVRKAARAAHSAAAGTAPPPAPAGADPRLRRTHLTALFAEGGQPRAFTVRPARPAPRRRAAGPQPAAGRRARRPAHRPRPVAAAHAARAPRPDHRPDHPARLRHHPRRHRPAGDPVPVPGRRPVPAPGPRRVVPAALHPGRGRRDAARRRGRHHARATSATAATGPWRSPCRPASPTTRARTGSSPRWPPPPAPAAARPALECWWGERRCAAAWGEHARPDGYGRWSEQAPGQPAAVADFFLEYDTGSEPLSRVIAKLAGYAALAARTGITTPVLFWLRSPSREAALHARLAGPPPPGVRDAASAAQIPGVPVATAARGTGPGGPAGAAWLPAGSPGPRLRLAQLAPPGTVQAGGGPDGEAPGGPPGGLAWHPP